MILSTEELAQIRSILLDSKTIAVVGMSPKPQRPSHRVAVYLMAAGYTVIPVNPGQDEILGMTCYPDLRGIPVAVDLVDIFRRPEAVLPVVEDAIEIGARYIWMQEGIVNEAAAAKARTAGLAVVMDRCTMVDHKNLL